MGQGKANPLATILSFAMMLRYSFDMDEDARAIETAAEQILNDGYRTPDIRLLDRAPVSTADMGTALIRALETAAH